MSGGVPAGEKPSTLCLACCRTLKEHGTKRQCPETTYFIANRVTPTPPIEGRDADVEREARFLLDRLVDHEVRMTSEQDAREWHGHVTPSMARLRAALQALGERG